MTGILGGLIGSLGSKLSLQFVDVLSFSGTAAQSTLTITHPVAVRAGDVMILFHGTYDNDNDFINTYPTSFTPIYTDAYLYTTETYMAIAVSARILPNLTNITTPVPVGTTADGHYYFAIYYRPSAPVTTLTPSTPTNQNTTGDPTAQTVTVSSNTNPTLVFGSIQTTGTTPAFNTATPAFDNEVTANAVGIIRARVGYKLYNSSPQNHTIDMADLGTQRLTSFSLQVS